MSGAVATAAVFAVDAAALLCSIALGIWLPLLAAVALTVLLAAQEARLYWRRWHATRRWVRRPWS